MQLRDRRVARSVGEAFMSHFKNTLSAAFPKILLLAFVTMFTVSGCEATAMRSDATVQPIEPVPISESESEYVPTSKASHSIDQGDETYRGFVLDCILHSPSTGDIHYSIHIPNSYDPSRPAPLFITLPGYQGLYFQGAGQNLYTEEFAFTAMEYDEDMIIVAPQLNDWGDTSAEQTIALIEALMSEYSIDSDRIFIEGYSGGGETLSLVLAKRPDLFAAAAHYSSQWDGNLKPVVDSQTPVYIAIGKNDEYYGPESAQQAASELRNMYRDAGLGESAIDELVVLDIKPPAYFEAGGYKNQHGSGSPLFANDDSMMGWLFNR